MTTVVVPAQPPIAGSVCTEVVEGTPLTPEDGAELYRAALQDVFTALAESNADVLVNYPRPENVPASTELEESPEAILRGIAGAVVDPDRLDDFRFEVQVGSDFSAIVGNAITYLLEEAGETSAAVLRPCVPRVVRSILDEAAIKMRRTDVVLGGAGDGEVYFAGFTEPIDFAGAFEDVPIETIAQRGGEQGLTVDFLRNREVLRTPRDFRRIVIRLRANMLAGKPVPTHLWEFIEERGLSVADGSVRITAGTN